jgi:hypothetical protein
MSFRKPLSGYIDPELPHYRPGRNPLESLDSGLREPRQDPSGPIECRSWPRFAPADAASKSNSSPSIGVRPKACPATSTVITRTRFAASARWFVPRGCCSRGMSAASSESPRPSTIVWRRLGSFRSHGGGGSRRACACGCSHRGMLPGCGRYCARCFTGGGRHDLLPRAASTSCGELYSLDTAAYRISHRTCLARGRRTSWTAVAKIARAR